VDPRNFSEPNGFMPFGSQRRCQGGVERLLRVSKGTLQLPAAPACNLSASFCCASAQSMSASITANPVRASAQQAMPVLHSALLLMLRACLAVCLVLPRPCQGHAQPEAAEGVLSAGQQRCSQQGSRGDPLSRAAEGVPSQQGSRGGPLSRAAEGSSQQGSRGGPLSRARVGTQEDPDDFFLLKQLVVLDVDPDHRYVGFDMIANGAEEAKNPTRDVPLATALCLALCPALYAAASTVIAGRIFWSRLYRTTDTPQHTQEAVTTCHNGSKLSCLPHPR